jgi:hypothetical protein
VAKALEKAAANTHLAKYSEKQDCCQARFARTAAFSVRGRSERLGGSGIGVVRVYCQSGRSKNVRIRAGRWQQNYKANGLEVLKYPFNFLFQDRQILFYRQPDFFQINAKILMNQFITHPCNIGPRNLRIRIAAL